MGSKCYADDEAHGLRINFCNKLLPIRSIFYREDLFYPELDLWYVLKRRKFNSFSDLAGQ